MFIWPSSINNSFVMINIPICNECRLPLWEDPDFTGYNYTCKCSSHKKVTTAQVGWICPKCDSGVAPNIERCPCVSIDNKRHTYGRAVLNLNRNGNDTIL